MTRIRLLGPPAVERTGTAVRQPRGRKAWGLLGYVLLAERPPSRRRLSELFFADADDPLGALRWSLAELRRAIGVPGLLTGDPVIPGLDARVTVDVFRLTAAGPREGSDDVAGDELLAAGELLEGIELDSCPEFESWLLIERRRVASEIEAQLRQRAISRLASGEAAAAVPFAARAVNAEPARAGQPRAAGP